MRILPRQKNWARLLIGCFALTMAWGCGESAKGPANQTQTPDDKENLEPMEMQRHFEAPNVEEYNLGPHIDLSVPKAKRGGEDGQRKDLMLRPNVFQLPDAMAEAVKTGADTVTFPREDNEYLMKREPGDIVISMANERFAWRKIKEVNVSDDQIQWKTETPPIQDVVKKGRFRAKVRVNPETLQTIPERVELALPYLHPDGAPYSVMSSMRQRRQRQSSASLSTGKPTPCAPCEAGDEFVDDDGDDACWVADAGESPFPDSDAGHTAFCQSLENIVCEQKTTFAPQNRCVTLTSAYEAKTDDDGSNPRCVPKKTLEDGDTVPKNYTVLNPNNECDSSEIDGMLNGGDGVTACPQIQYPPESESNPWSSGSDAKFSTVKDILWSWAGGGLPEDDDGNTLEQSDFSGKTAANYLSEALCAPFETGTDGIERRCYKETVDKHSCSHFDNVNTAGYNSEDDYDDEMEQSGYTVDDVKCKLYDGDTGGDRDFPDSSEYFAGSGDTFDEQGICTVETCQHSFITGLVDYYKGLSDEDPVHPDHISDDADDPRSKALSQFQTFTSEKTERKQSCVYKHAECLKTWEAFRQKHFDSAALDANYGDAHLAGSKDFCDLSKNSPNTACETDSDCDNFHSAECVGDPDTTNGEKEGTCQYTGISAPQDSQSVDAYGVVNPGSGRCKQNCKKGVRIYSDSDGSGKFDSGEDVATITNDNNRCEINCNCPTSCRSKLTNDTGNECDTTEDCGTGQYCDPTSETCVEKNSSTQEVHVVVNKNVGTPCNDPSNPSCPAGSFCSEERGECVEPEVVEKSSYQYFYDEISETDDVQTNVERALALCESQSSDCSSECQTCRSLECTSNCVGTESGFAGASGDPCSVDSDCPEDDGEICVGDNTPNNGTDDGTCQKPNGQTCRECIYKTSCTDDCSEIRTGTPSSKGIEQCLDERYCSNSFHKCRDPGFCAPQQFGASGNPCNCSSDNESCSACEDGEICQGDSNPDDETKEGTCQKPTGAGGRGGIQSGNPNLVEKILSMGFSLLMGKSPLAIIKQMAIPHPNIPSMPQFKTDQIRDIKCSRPFADDVPESAWMTDGDEDYNCDCSSASGKCRADVPMGNVKAGARKLRQKFPVGSALDAIDNIGGKLEGIGGSLGENAKRLTNKIPGGLGGIMGGSSSPLKRIIPGAGFDFTTVLDVDLSFLPPGLDVRVGIRADFFFGLIFEFNFRKTKDWQRTARAGPIMLIPFNILGFPLPIQLELHAGAEFHAFVQSSIAMGAAYFTVPETLSDENMNKSERERDPSVVPPGGKVARAGAWPSDKFMNNWWSSATRQEAEDWRAENDDCGSDSEYCKKNEKDHWGIDLVYDSGGDGTSEMNTSFAKMVRAKLDLEADFKAEAGLQIGLYAGDPTGNRLIFFEPANLFFHAYAAILSPYCGAGVGLYYRMFLGFGPLEILGFTLAEGFRIPLLIEPIFVKDWLFPPIDWRSQGPGDLGDCALANPGSASTGGNDLDVLTADFAEDVDGDGQKLGNAKKFFCRLAHTLGCIQVRQPPEPEPERAETRKCTSDSECGSGVCSGNFCVDQKPGDLRLTMHWRDDADLDLVVHGPDQKYRPSELPDCGNDSCPEDKTCENGDYCPDELNTNDVFQPNTCYGEGGGGSEDVDGDEVYECQSPHLPNSHAESLTIPAEAVESGEYELNVANRGVGYSINPDPACNPTDPSQGSNGEGDYDERCVDVCNVDDGETLPDYCKVGYTIEIQHEGKTQTFTGKAAPGAGVETKPIRYVFEAVEGAGDSSGNAALVEPQGDLRPQKTESDSEFLIFPENIVTGNPKRNKAQNWCDGYESTPTCGEVSCTNGSRKDVAEVTGWTAVEQTDGDGWKCVATPDNIDVTKNGSDNNCKTLSDDGVDEVTQACVNDSSIGGLEVPEAVMARAPSSVRSVPVDRDFVDSDGELSIPADGSVRSYYMHYDPHGSSGGVKMCGSVTFEHKILGLGYENSSLGAQTPKVLACSPDNKNPTTGDIDSYECSNGDIDTTYPTQNGWGPHAFESPSTTFDGTKSSVDWPSECSTDSTGDYWEVSDDRHTISFEVNTSGNTDQMRIITAGPPKNE